MKQTYVRCPRCELNYILKKDKFCNVCKQEMKALGTLGAEENLDLELCPICKINYINPDEDICPACAKERELEDGEDGVGKYDSDNDWSSYTNPEDDDSGYEDEETGDMVSITNLDDTPIEDDDMDLGLSDEDDDMSEEDETFDSDFDDTFDNLDDDDDEDDDEEYEDNEEDEKPKKKRK